ncbi:MutS-related protein [Mangrovactinospora gilvigrisea]|uniref:MutS-related protein n=1 Tax=Mangrovactinospora gilvigrisea TaxID=1428644 RepID=UPI0009A10D35|nr:hypothetical protein [Mangrovactinospora gilvigrisea]
MATSALDDLNLTALIDALLLTQPPGERDALAPRYRTGLTDPADVAHRHEIVRDLSNTQVSDAVRGFTRALRNIREHLSLGERLPHPLQNHLVRLEAVHDYGAAVTAFAEALTAPEAEPDGLGAALGELVAHLRSALTPGTPFAELRAAADKVTADLAEVRYTLHIRANRISVSRHRGERDHGADIAGLFARFRREGAPSHLAAMPRDLEMDPVEARILGLVADLNPEPFAALEEFAAKHRDFLDPVLVDFDHEIRFYLAYLDFTGPLRDAGLPFCLPRINEPGGPVRILDGYDLALADKLAHERPDTGAEAIVVNSVALEPPERLLVVTGPNQGGKTTFARMFGQLHHLAALGLPVPAADAELPLPDNLFTHFEREEDLRTLRGKLDDELVRIREALEEATSRSVVIMNESFSSTSLHDARFIGEHVLDKLAALDVTCLYVTFVDELAALPRHGERTVSLVATIVPDDPSQRTYRLVRRPADGRAYATAIAAKYGLTHDALRERLR